MSKVKNEVKNILELPDKARIKIIKKGIWVQYPLADKLISHLEELLYQPKRPRMEGRGIIGDTNNGKTSIVQEFIDIQKRKSGNKDDDFYDILYVEAPEVPSVKSLYIEILTECNLKHSTKTGTTEQLKQKMLKALRDLNVKMLFIDEIHNLLSAQNERILQQCLNALKGLSNRLQIPIILVGTEEAEGVIKSDGQILSRYRIIRLNKWKKDKSFLLLLKSFEKALPLRKPSNLHNSEISKMMYELSEGILGNISIIIRESAIEAIKTGEERITTRIIKILHENIFAKF